MTAAPGPVITCGGAVPCPECGAKVIGRWVGTIAAVPQTCGQCGARFRARWPGFNSTRKR